MRLEALGLLGRLRAFGNDAVFPAWLDAFGITIQGRESFYAELIEPLRQRGRGDLADKIAAKLTASKKMNAPGQLWNPGFSKSLIASG